MSTEAFYCSDVLVWLKNPLFRFSTLLNFIPFKNLFMKTINFFTLALVAMFSLQSCVKDQCQREITYIKRIPIYKSFAEIRADVRLDASKELVDPGKIYFYNNYIFINEKREGVHIIDNSDPSAPDNIGFLSIPGNVDIAIRNQVLYADNFTDLLSIDIADLQNPKILKRTQDAFPHFGLDASGNALVYYEHEEVTEIVDCETSGGRWGNQDDLFVLESAGDKGGSPDAGGVGGSLARFTIADGHLFTVDETDLRVFSLGQSDCPVQVNTVSLGWGIETIYAFDGKLFFGSNTGMSIYDISDPSNPTYLSGYDHWTSCDPVYVNGNYAYVTLRSGTLCNGSTINQLDLIDITDITNPRLVNSFQMDNPHGLSGKDDKLFLCEGQTGLKVFDISDPLRLNSSLIQHLDGRPATDVIVVPGNKNTLLVIGDTGFHQYNFDQPNDLQELSFIPVASEK